MNSRGGKVQRRLSDLKPGEGGKIVRITGPPSLRRRLLDMGLVKGAYIEVVRKAPLGDPMEFLVKGYNLSLRKEECDNVYVST